MTSSRPDDARTTCANCDSPLTGPFCPMCGQKDLGTRVTLWELLREVVSETFEIEGRLPRTLLSIAIRPGEYLGEYLDGKRKSYASPFRFYLVMVFVAAIAMGWRGQSFAGSIGGVNIETTVSGPRVQFIAKRDLLDAPETYIAFPVSSFPKDDVACDVVLPCYPTSATEFSSGVDWLASLQPMPSLVSYNDAAEHVFRRLAVLGPDHIYRVLYRGWVQQLPVLMAVMLLGLSTSLKLLWPKTPATVAVVTSMVLHALALVGIVFAFLVPQWWMVACVGLWLSVHVVLGLRRAFGSGWPRTLASSAVLVVLWGGSALMGLAFSAYRMVVDLASVGL